MIAFALLPGPYALIVVLFVPAGTARGNLTVLRAAAVTDRWETAHYSRFSGAPRLRRLPLQQPSHPAPEPPSPSCSKALPP
ncbi:hypothetical protein ACFVGY_14755 [Streptomyces sp. NPDC127106]|uniref:hypothetical protein n=1 Tax=Streptomyces sp. NPDC127106 TaxID=3345360 RepID=UPI0036429854